MQLTPATIAAISTATVQGDNATDACVVKLTIITDKTFLPAAFKACVAKVTNSTPRVHRFGWTDPVINAYNDSALLCQTWYTGLAHDFKTIEPPCVLALSNKTQVIQDSDLASGNGAFLARRET
ncbi:unnamed protein product [Aphanomyces euteiches]